MNGRNEAVGPGGDAPPATLPGLIRLHRNTAHWYNNASFALPLAAGLIGLAVGLGIGSDELIGFGLFLLAIALIMTPVVLWSWRATPTAIAITDSALVSLHHEREMKRLEWGQVVEIERRETLGNLRWRILDRNGGHIAIEGEIEDVPGLLEAVKRLSGRQEEEVLVV